MWVYRKTDTATDDARQTWMIAIGAILMVVGLASLTSS